MPQPLLAFLMKFRIGPRLIAGFLLVACGCAFLGYTALGALSEIRVFQVNAGTNLVPSALNLDKFRAGALRVQRGERTLIVVAKRNDEKLVQATRGNIDAGWKMLAEGMKGYGSLPMSDKEAALWKELQSALTDWKRDHEEIVSLVDRREYEKAEDASLRELKTANRMNDSLQEALALQEEIAKDEDKQANSSYTSARSTLFATIAGCVLAAIGLGLAISVSVTGPLGQTVAVLEGVAKGDLTKRAEVNSQDEVGRMAVALNTAIGSLVAAKEVERVQVEKERERAEKEAATKREQAEREAKIKQEQADRDAALAAELRQKVDTIVMTVDAMAAGDFTQQVPDLGTDAVGQMAVTLNKAIVSVRAALEGVREVSEQLADASGQLSSASDEISTGAQEQASSLEETASTLEEITATVKQNADSAQQARQLASSSKEVAEKGGAVVGNAVEAMGEINQSSKKISDIITTIDEIAFQTNLLALNAAVEAARAGEQGRGFAVVASEVRNLAQRSATAAKEIKSLIEDSVKKVDAGTELVNRSGVTLGEIVTSVKRVTDLITEIAAAGKEQSTGIEQVNKAVSQMDTVTQKNASQTEEMSATAQTLTDQAGQLRDLVSRFKLSDSGRMAPRPAPKASRGKPSSKPRPAVARALSKTHDLDRMGSGGDGGFTEF
ncbi:MCP four helix bundle domain-containing protein [Gemmata sp. G18]|uniref:MCP four helix bundle domain-containing protein n=1 Tax=Gemmata palustris TaxID=2822762 RepID=A0ABS5BSP2_9BACT|nr:methyl-accepting chemotaxis protein [Gemmata palustris]MBP3956685.1 MCP four helix bundle domain-containing protein [Gemmata palustris]